MPGGPGKKPAINAPPRPPAHARAGRPPAGTVLCMLADIADPGTREFGFGAGKDRFEGFLVRQGARVFGYLNECPHALTPLNMMPDRFLTWEKDALICRTHGACFTLDTGFCTKGPCKGRSLIAWPVSVRDGQIVTV